MSFVVTLPQGVAELFVSLTTRPAVRTMQYSITFCCRPEAAGDVISDTFVRHIVPDEAVKFRDPGAYRSIYVCGFAF